jgi:AcrR family transcriptional regulator
MPVTPARPDPNRGGARPLRKDAARNRELLIQAAREVFAVRGFQASMDEIAHHAGLGVGTAYRHFANKYELANAIFDTAVAAFVDSAEEAMSVSDPWEGLVAVVERTLEAQTDNRAVREILLGINQDDPEHHDSMVAPLAPLFERAQDGGAIRPDAAPSDLAMALVMLCTVADTTAEESPELWRRYLPTVLEGLRPGGPPMPVPPLTAEGLDRALNQHKPRRVGSAG